ncbi:hypothetical protein COOONC_14743 [Cooperia oncophora]
MLGKDKRLLFEYDMPNRGGFYGRRNEGRDRRPPYRDSEWHRNEAQRDRRSPRNFQPQPPPIYP